jgi:hypothetical protein
MSSRPRREAAAAGEKRRLNLGDGSGADGDEDWRPDRRRKRQTRGRARHGRRSSDSGSEEAWDSDDEVSDGEDGWDSEANAKDESSDALSSDSDSDDDDDDDDNGDGDDERGDDRRGPSRGRSVVGALGREVPARSAAAERSDRLAARQESRKRRPRRGATDPSRRDAPSESADGGDDGDDGDSQDGGHDEGLVLQEWRPTGSVKEAQQALAHALRECERIAREVEARLSQLRLGAQAGEHGCLRGTSLPGGKGRSALLAQPKSVGNRSKLQLSEYQLVGLNWLHVMRRMKLSCILADESARLRSRRRLARPRRLPCAIAF